MYSVIVHLIKPLAMETARALLDVYTEALNSFAKFIKYIINNKNNHSNFVMT